MLVRTLPTPAPSYPLGPWSSYAGLGNFEPVGWLQGETMLGGFAVPNMALAAGAALSAFYLFSGGRRRRRGR